MSLVLVLQVTSEFLFKIVPSRSLFVFAATTILQSWHRVPEHFIKVSSIYKRVLLSVNVMAY